jgi:hypothetical protein
VPTCRHRPPRPEGFCKLGIVLQLFQQSALSGLA